MGDVRAPLHLACIFGLILGKYDRATRHLADQKRRDALCCARSQRGLEFSDQHIDLRRPVHSALLHLDRLFIAATRGALGFDFHNHGCRERRRGTELSLPDDHPLHQVSFFSAGNLGAFHAKFPKSAAARAF